jgi:sulfoxide reductase heme-binding subunit YedZ
MTFNTLFRSIPISLLYCILLLPVPLYFYWGVINRLGPDPLRYLEHKYGELGLIFLLVTLSISPLLRYTKINLVKFRRCLGLVTFYYIFSHICVYIFLDIGLSMDILISDLKKRYYIIAGVLAFITLIPLALTSNNFAIRKLNIRTWRKIHNFVYIALILSIFHFVLMSKTWTGELYFYTAVTLILLILKIKEAKLYKKLSTYSSADISK